MRPHSPKAYQLLQDGAIALAEVEANGIRVDRAYVRRAQRRLARRVADLTKQLHADPVLKIWRDAFRTRTNLDSNDQLATVLFELMGLDCPVLTSTGKPSVKESVLDTIEGVPFIKTYLRIKKLKKASGTFLAGIERATTADGFMHPFFNLHIVVTFRSSSDSPNFQNFPKRDKELKRIVRRAIIPRMGNVILELDFKGVEVATAACYHHDPRMIRYIEDPSSDMHRDMAAQIFMLAPEEITGSVRHLGKNEFVFPEFYGSYWPDVSAALWISAQKVRTASGVLLVEHLKGLGIQELGDQNRKTPKPGTFEAHVQKVERDFWGKRFKVYDAWRKKWYQDYLENGFFKTKTEFICQGLMSRNDAINYGVQGSAFHILLWCLIRLQRMIKRRGMKAKIIGQIHDSIVADVPEEEVEDFISMANKIMTRRLPAAWDWINVPMRVDVEATPVDGSWHEMAEIE